MLSGRRRIVAAVATLVAFGGIVTVTQVSDAGTRSQQRALAACNKLTAPAANKKLSTETRKGTWTTSKGVTHHSDDGASDAPTTAQMRTACRNSILRGRNGRGNGSNGGGASTAPSQGTGGSNGGGDNGGGGAAPPAPGAGLGVLANSCDGSDLDPHDGFQLGSKCVSTEFGEVGSQENNPTLLITDAPQQVDVNEAFQIQVSTRNLIRDRFLAAGQGGYYVESSLLNGQGLVRGHFHTACKVVNNTNEAPAPDPVPEFFVATEDGGGSRNADTVTIQVPGLPNAGTAVCSSWAGDGSHRIPMMQRANQMPAIDSVRVEVGGGGGGGGQGGGGRRNNNN
jgi:hypothetical protein